MILHLYFARRFALAFTYVLGGFLILFVLLDFIEQMRRFRGLDVTLSQKAHLVALYVPSALYQTAPVDHRALLNHVVFEPGAQQ